MNKHYLFVLLLGLLTNILNIANGAENNEGLVIKAFENQINKDLEDDGINGSISAVILKKNKIIWSKAIGHIDHKKMIVADEDSIYRIGSMTKSITGFLLILLHQEEVININEPIEKYLPEVKLIKGYSNATKITFKQLASHTSGLAREPQLRSSHSGSISEWEKKLISSIPHTSFRSRPGKRFSYSNIGFGILGLALSRAAKMPFIQLVEEKILKPLKMTNTYFRVPTNKKTNLSVGMGGGPLARLDLELPKLEHAGRGYKIPNGSLYSTPTDLAKFIMAVMGYSDLLSQKNLLLLQKSHTPTSNLRENYALGFQLYSKNNFSTVSHGGSTPGYSAHFEFNDKSRYGVVIMRNYNWGNTNFDLRVNALLKQLANASDT